jgi:hypothetical protein
MLEVIDVQSDRGYETQLHTIRDLMLAAARRGAWLTLGEIAELTEIGEASVSAQLRHLRKRQHGLHLVEKRRRLRHLTATHTADRTRSAKKRMATGPVMWEYRVLPSVSSARTGGVGNAEARD